MAVDLTQITIGILVFGLVIVGFTISIADLSQKYNTTITDQINSSLYIVTQNFENASKSSTDFYNTSTKTPASQTSDSGISISNVIRGTFNLIESTFIISKIMLNTIATTLHIPQIFISSMIAVIVLAIGIIFASAILRNRL